MGNLLRPCAGGRVFRGTGLGLIPIHPVLHRGGMGTISRACFPLLVHCDLCPHVYGCCLYPFIPPFSYYLQYLLLLIPPLVNAHAALMLKYKTQVRSAFLASP